MMMSPEAYRKENENLSLEELINNRNKLLKAISDYENKKGEGLSEGAVKPSPETVYYWNNFYLKEITDLIINKLK